MNDIIEALDSGYDVEALLCRHRSFRMDTIEVHVSLVNLC